MTYTPLPRCEPTNYEVLLLESDASVVLLYLFIAFPMEFELNYYI